MVQGCSGEIPGGFRSLLITGVEIGYRAVTLEVSRCTLLFDEPLLNCFWTVAIHFPQADCWYLASPTPADDIETRNA